MPQRNPADHREPHPVGAVGQDAERQGGEQGEHPGDGPQRRQPGVARGRRRRGSPGPARRRPPGRTRRRSSGRTGAPAAAPRHRGRAHGGRRAPPSGSGPRGRLTVSSRTVTPGPPRRRPQVRVVRRPADERHRTPRRSGTRSWARQRRRRCRPPRRGSSASAMTSASPSPVSTRRSANSDGTRMPVAVGHPAQERVADLVGPLGEAAREEQQHHQQAGAGDEQGDARRSRLSPNRSTAWMTMAPSTAPGSEVSPPITTGHEDQDRRA